MELFFNATGWVGLCLMACNWQWSKWGGRYAWCVPGSLQQAHAAAMRRRYRWPGFMFWPVVIPGWLYNLATGVAGGSHWAWVWLLFSVLGAFSMRSDYRRLRRELDEDDDDWLNRAKRGLRRWAAGAVRSAAAVAPRPSPVPL